MKHLFVPNDIAKKLKEKMFDEPCLAYYSGSDLEDKTLYTFTTFSIGSSIHRNGIEGFDKSYTFSAPIHQQVVDWLRDKHNIVIESTTWVEVTTWMIRNRMSNETVWNSAIKDYYEGYNKAISEALNRI